MEKEILKILIQVKYRKLTPKDAQKQVLGLFSVSNNEERVAVCDHKEYRWHDELEDNTEECVNCGHIKQTDC